MNRPPRRHRGFTLVEVLVALVVVAMALGAVITAVSHYADSAHYLTQKTLANWAAHNLLTETALSGEIPDSGDHDDDKLEFAGHEWLSRVSTLKTPDPRIVRVNASIWPEDAQRDDDTPLITLSGFFIQ